MSNWKPGMSSPNPRGRPKKKAVPRDAALYMLREALPEVVLAVLAAAKRGDAAAAARVLRYGLDGSEDAQT